MTSHIPINDGNQILLGTKVFMDLGQMVSSLRSPEDSVAESIVESVDLEFDDEGKNEMFEETEDSEDVGEDEASEDDLMVAESDDDYSNDLYFSGNVDQVKSNDTTSVKPSFPNESMKPFGRLDLINSINDSTRGPLILSKLPVERFDQRQKSLRFPLMMPRTHRNVTRLREGCSLRPSEFSKPKTFTIHWKHDNP
uniref:Uncharacterized protein n=1 Tax=Tetranychus urticae TaxID=32264 RepID=T1L3Q1_TETUR